MPSLPKGCPKMVSAPKKRSLSVKDVFAKKFFGVRAFRWRRLRSAAASIQNVLCICSDFDPSPDNALSFGATCAIQI
jgi:hypothetical protein